MSDSPISDDLLRLVQAELLPALRPARFEVNESEVSDVFDNATVVLQSPDLRIRITRDRGRTVVDFGPSAEPGAWFDADVVLEQLGLSVDRSFDRGDAERALQGVTKFLAAFLPELVVMFDPQHLESTRAALDALRMRRAQRLFDWVPPTAGPRDNA